VTGNVYGDFFAWSVLSTVLWVTLYHVAILVFALVAVSWLMGAIRPLRRIMEGYRD
jgi:hypothetical protein